jgi:DNA repair exonuclease SbcCD ATPase subunit
VNISEPRSSWQNITALGMLTAQFIILALIAWRLLSPPAAAPQGADARDAQIALLQGRVDQLVEAQRLEAQTELLDRVFQELKDAPPGAVSSLIEQKEKNDQLETENRGLRALERELASEKAGLQRSLKVAQSEQARLERNLKELRVDHRELSVLSASRADEIEALEDRLSKLEEGDDEDKAGVSGWFSDWTTATIAALATIAAAAVGAAVWLWRKAASDSVPPLTENGGGETNT